MTIPNQTSFWQKIQRDSVSWGSLGLWILSLMTVLTIIWMFAI